MDDPRQTLLNAVERLYQTATEAPAPKRIHAECEAAYRLLTGVLGEDLQITEHETDED